MENKPEGKEPEKLTEEQQKAKDAAEQAKREEGEQEMNKLADSLRAEAAAGEDFAKLQKEAFEAAGTKVANPTVNLPKVRRTGLPPAHASVFDLKVGEVSAVISDNGGHYVYKVVSEEVLPLDAQIESEIHNRLKAERLKEMMEKYTNSFQAVQNEAYFGPAGPEGPMGGRPPGLPPRAPRPQMTPPRDTAARRAAGLEARLMASAKPVVVVTGIAGNLGSRLLPLLGDFSVIGVDLSPPQTDLPLQFERLDLGEESSTRALYEMLRDTQPVSVVHLAFVIDPVRTGVLDTERMWQINVAGTARVMEAVTEANRTADSGIKQFIFPSSVSAYGSSLPGPATEDSVDGGAHAALRDSQETIR